MPRSTPRALALTALAMLALAAPALAAYTIADIGSLGRNSYATAINDIGDVAGWAFVNDSLTHAIRYVGGGLQDLGTLGGNTSYAFGINHAGVIVGQSNAFSNGPLRPVKWSAGTWSDLGDLGGATGAAFGINNAGEIVGQSDKSGGITVTHGFLYKNNVMTDLGTLGGQFSTGFAISPSSQIVGIAALSGTAGQHAASWQSGLVTDLGTLGGTFGVAKAVNDLGDVVGYASKTGITPQHAFLRAAGSGLNRDLGTLGGTNSQALGINHNRVMVGWSDMPTDSVHHAFVVYGAGNVMLDLNTLLPPNSGWILYEAYAVNDNGTIVGNGRHQNGVRGFVMTLSGALDVQSGEPDVSQTRFAGATPNPAPGRADFAFTLAQPGRARLALYDLSGRVVRTLADREFGAGAQRVAWDGRDDAGRSVAQGLYFARLESAGRTLTRRVTVMP